MLRGAGWGTDGQSCLLPSGGVGSEARIMSQAEAGPLGRIPPHLSLTVGQHKGLEPSFCSEPSNHNFTPRGEPREGQQDSVLWDLGLGKGLQICHSGPA